jgi:hypothetical protein
MAQARRLLSAPRMIRRVAFLMIIAAGCGRDALEPPPAPPPDPCVQGVPHAQVRGLPGASGPVEFALTAVVGFFDQNEPLAGLYAGNGPTNINTDVGFAVEFTERPTTASTPSLIVFQLSRSNSGPTWAIGSVPPVLTLDSVCLDDPSQTLTLHGHLSATLEPKTDNAQGNLTVAVTF